MAKHARMLSTNSQPIVCLAGATFRATRCWGRVLGLSFLEDDEFWGSSIAGPMFDPPEFGQQKWRKARIRGYSDFLVPDRMQRLKRQRLFPLRPCGGQRHLSTARARALPRRVVLGPRISAQCPKYEPDKRNIAQIRASSALFRSEILCIEVPVGQGRPPINDVLRRSA